MKKLLFLVCASITVAGCFNCEVVDVPTQGPIARDPGVRAGAPGAGGPISSLTPAELTIFEEGKVDFKEVESLEDGLGPTMNLDSCVGCHSHPETGGTSPPINPQIDFAAQDGARNKVPSFLSKSGPVREVRFVKDSSGKSDGGVHALFTITGRKGATGCELSQPDFEAELARHNVVFRIPTPTFGAGLMELIPDSAILENVAKDYGGGKDPGVRRRSKTELGIHGRPNFVIPFQTISGQPNKNGNDGTLGRFGWKAQNKSLLIFSGEAYNVEMGITNETFPTEREEAPSCQFAAVPNSVTEVGKPLLKDGLSSIEKFAMFMRFLAPPAPSTDTPGGASSIQHGKLVFEDVGCVQCHTPTLRTGNATVAALRNQDVHLYSDLLIHNMGVKLADGVSQGQADGNEFRSAPLWGLGKRTFFLHDGRTADLRAAIFEHSSKGSEANEVIKDFQRLSEPDKQDLLNFLRSL